MEVAVLVTDDNLGRTDRFVFDGSDAVGLNRTFRDGVGDVGLDARDFEGCRRLRFRRLVSVCRLIISAEDGRRARVGDCEDEEDDERVDDVDSTEESAFVVDGGHYVF